MVLMMHFKQMNECNVLFALHLPCVAKVLAKNGENLEMQVWQFPLQQIMDTHQHDIMS